MKLPGKPSRSPLVSLTPLIDVVFILLIFFMLVSQFMQLQKQSIPISQTGKTNASQKGQIIIKLILDKRLQRMSYNINNLSVNWSQLQEYLKDKVLHEVVLIPDPNISLQQFIQVKEKLSNLGIKKINSELIGYEIN